MAEYNIESIEHISLAADKIILNYPDTRIFGFYGDLGAGKTTLIKAICEKLGVLDVIQSPTFSLINEYLTSNNSEIYHFDFYRIGSIKEALDLGIEEYFMSKSYCFIEWPEIIEDFLPENFARIEISSTGKNSRLLKY